MCSYVEEFDKSLGVAYCAETLLENILKKTLYARTETVLHAEYVKSKKPISYFSLKRYFSLKNTSVMGQESFDESW